MKPDATQTQRSKQDVNATPTRPAAASSLILLVDDNEMNRDMLGRRLRRSQFHVEEVASGREALERWAVKVEAISNEGDEKVAARIG